MNVYTLERSSCEVREGTSATDAEDPFNEILRRVGEPPCANASEAFGAVVKLMQTSIGTIGSARPDFSTDPTQFSLKGDVMKGYWIVSVD